MMRQTLVLAAAACALATAGSAIAQPESNSPSAEDIVARAHARPMGFIATSGPDVAGHYAVAIDVSGIDPTTPAGWARINRRVDVGLGQLCDLAGAHNLITGPDTPERAACLADGRAAADAQMHRARAAAERGEKVATLGISTAG
jgi:hypothetical protein